MPALEVADIFRRHGEAFRQAQAGHLGRTERRVMGAIEACRTAALGGHVERCAECGLIRIAYNSCRNRHCPKCQGRAQATWLVERQAELLPMPYFHVVFTVPAAVRVVRYYIRVSEKIVWADRPEDLVQHLPTPETLPPGVDPPRPISVTFIPAKVFDNPALLQANPEYFAWLLSLPLLERERLLGGNWKIRPAAGLYFKRQWCAVVGTLDGENAHVGFVTVADLPYMDVVAAARDANLSVLHELQRGASPGASE